MGRGGRSADFVLGGVTGLILNQLEVVLDRQPQQVERNGNPDAVRDGDVEPQVGEVANVQIGASNDPL